MGKHGFAEKLHLKLKWFLRRLELIHHFAVRTSLSIRNAFSGLEKISHHLTTVEYHTPQEHRKVVKDLGVTSANG
jgi:hypothetical protein